MFTLGPNEIIVIGVLIALLFGASKLPKLARSLGKASGEFRKAQLQAEIELREYERQLKQGKQPDRVKLEKIAKDLGIDPEDKDDDDIISEIKSKL